MDGVGGVGGAAFSGGGSGGGMDGDEGGGGSVGSWHGGAQLYVSLKMENARIIGDLVPHVYGSEPIIGSWDPAHAVRTRHPPHGCHSCSLACRFWFTL